MNEAGKLIVVSGPSGVGKGTIVSQLVERHPDVWLSVSATTRRPRSGEVDSVNYFFLSKEDFEDLIAKEGFAEWAEYSGNYYGTPIKALEEKIEEGKTVILEIEVQGALNIKRRIPSAKLVFVEAPSLDELRKRLEGRGTEDVQTIERRMSTAMLEMAQKKEYDMVLVNDDLDQAVGSLEKFIFGKQ